MTGFLSLSGFWKPCANRAIFPLANNVQHLRDGTEKMGLGRAILDLKGSTISHAQGSSYLGVVLEECGISSLEWGTQGDTVAAQ